MTGAEDARVVLITGGSGSIGRAIVTELVERKYRVAFTWLSAQAEAEDLVAMHGEPVRAYRCDVADSSSVRAVMQRVSRELGPILRVVNNAGMTRPRLLPLIRSDDWDEVLNVNLRGPFAVVQVAIKAMLRERFGRIVNLGSVAASTGSAGQAHYGAAKAGLIGFTRAIAREYGSRGITCNVVAPGFVETPMTASMASGLSELLVAAIPAGRPGSPWEIAYAVAALLDDRASYINGCTLTVDGGLGMGC